MIFGSLARVRREQRNKSLLRCILVMTTRTTEQVWRDRDRCFLLGRIACVIPLREFKILPRTPNDRRLLRARGNNILPWQHHDPKRDNGFNRRGCNDARYWKREHFFFKVPSTIYWEMGFLWVDQKQIVCNNTICSHVTQNKERERSQRNHFCQQNYNGQSKQCYTCSCCVIT